MPNHRISEVQQESQPAPACGDAWAAAAAAQCSPAQRGPVAEQVAAQSQSYQEQGLLGRITLSTLDQNFLRIDQSGNGNGVIERQDLTTFIARQQRVSEGARDNLAIMGAQNALRYMDTTGQETLTRQDISAGLKDGMLPATRDMQQASKQFDGIVGLVRKLNPDAITNGNQLNVGFLRESIEQQPHNYTKAQQQAIRTLVGDAGNLANSVGLFNRIGNFLWNGNDGRYISPESLAERAHTLGANTRVRPLPNLDR